MDISHRATTRFVSVYDERDPVEYRIVGPFDWSCTCYIDAGTLRMVGPLRPLEQPLSAPRDDNSGSGTQGQDNPYYLGLFRRIRHYMSPVRYVSYQESKSRMKLNDTDCPPVTDRN